MDFTAVLQIEGMPTLKEAEWAEAALDEGNRPFKEIIEPFLGW